MCLPRHVAHLSRRRLFRESLVLGRRAGKARRRGVLTRDQKRRQQEKGQHRLDAIKINLEFNY
jgi:hypothetical protein